MAVGIIGAASVACALAECRIVPFVLRAGKIKHGIVRVVHIVVCSGINENAAAFDTAETLRVGEAAILVGAFEIGEYSNAERRRTLAIGVAVIFVVAASVLQN